MSDFFVHERALVESEEIGKGTRVWANAHVMKDSSIGSDCNIGENVFVESGVTIKDKVVIKNNIAIYEGVTIEEAAFIGPNVVFTNDFLPRSRYVAEAAARYEDKSWLMETHVGKGASIGANATVICGVKIGEYAMVAAGAVVTKDVAPYSIVVGSPAKHYGFICRCGEKIHANGHHTCSVCKSKYIVNNTNVTYEGREE